MSLPKISRSMPIGSRIHANSCTSSSTLARCLPQADFDMHVRLVDRHAEGFLAPGLEPGAVPHDDLQIGKARGHRVDVDGVPVLALEPATGMTLVQQHRHVIVAADLVQRVDDLVVRIEPGRRVELQSGESTAVQ